MNVGEVIANSGHLFQVIGYAFTPFLLLPLLYILLPKLKLLTEVSDALIRTVDSLSYALGELTKWLLPILVLTIAFSVFALSIFGQSWTKLSESAEYFHAAIIMLGAAATLLAGQHVRVDVFHTNMNPKTRAFVDFVGYYTLLLPVCLIILWNSQSFISFSWRIFEGSAEADGIRGEFLLKTLVPIFALTMIIQGFAIALRAAMRLQEHAQPVRPANTPRFFADKDPKL